jgi:hypothetical protein
MKAIALFLSLVVAFLLVGTPQKAEEIGRAHV